jgi:hypothetical protein
MGEHVLPFSAQMHIHWYMVTQLDVEKMASHSEVRKVLAISLHNQT